MFQFSSWAAYFGAIFFALESVQALGAKTWMGAYIKAIPFCIYPIVALLIVILFSAGVFPKLGGMKKAYERVATTGKVYSDASKKYNLDDEDHFNLAYTSSFTPEQHSNSLTSGNYQASNVDKYVETRMHNVTLQYHSGSGFDFGGYYTHYTSDNNQT